MASRKKKPTKLRHELREYTSLIRTLHTTSTQDIIPHLTGSFLPPLSVPSTPSKRATSPPESLHDDASDEYRASRSPDEDEEVNEESKGKGRGEASEPMKRMYKDVWTRWPLLMNNVYVPEWTLQDEVRSIAEKAARRWADEHANGATPDESTSGDAKAVIDEEDKSDGSTREENESTGEESGSTEEDQDDSEEEPMETEPDEDLPLPEEDIITKGVLNGLSLEASNLLSHIFGMLAAHRPAVDASLQNRLGTMDWQTSLKIISSAGVIDRRILLSVQERMEDIYGPSEIQGMSFINLYVFWLTVSKASERVKVQYQVKRRVRDLEESLASHTNLFHFEDVPHRGKRRRITRQKSAS